MRSILLLILAAVLFSAVALFVWLRPASLTAEAAGPARAVLAGPADAAQEGATLESASADDSTDEAPASASTAAAPDRDPDRAEPRQVPGRPPAVLRGRVVDGRGEPVNGASVRAARHAATWPAPLDSLGPPGVAETFSDRTGHFALEVPGALAPARGRTASPPADALDGDARLAVRADGFAPLDLGELWVPSSGALDLGDLAFEPGIVLAGRVVDSDGHPVGRAQLTSLSAELPGDPASWSPMLGRPVAETDAAGEFRTGPLRPGPWRLGVLASGHPEAQFTGVTHLDESPAENLELVLSPGASIRGTVAGLAGDFAGSTRGLQAPRLFVHALPADAAVPWMEVAGEDPDAGRRGYRAWSQFRAGVVLGEVQSDGSFELHGLKPGAPYSLRALPQGVAADAVDAFSPWTLARGGDAHVLLAWHPGITVDGLVVDVSTGAPIEGFTVNLESAFYVDPLARGRSFRVERATGGRFTLLGLRPETLREDALFADLPEGEDLLLSIVAPFHDPALVPVTGVAAGRRVGLGRIALVPLRVALVRVADADGAPVFDARVQLVSMERIPGHRSRSAADTDAAGEAKLAFPPSDVGVVLAVSAPGHAPHFERLAPAPPVGFEVDVRLARAGTIVARVLDPSGEPVRAARVLRRVHEIELPAWARPARAEFGEVHSAAVATDAAGLARFEDLAPGVHVLRAESAARLFVPGPLDGLAWSEVAVAGGDEAEVTLIADRLEDLAGMVALDGRPLAGAVLRLVAGPWSHFPFVDMLDPAAVRVQECNASGEFRFELLVPGTYALAIDHTESGIATGRSITVLPGQGRIAIEVGDTGLSGTVFDGGGAPAAGVAVLVFAEPTGDSERLESEADLVWPPGARMPGPDLGRRPLASARTDDAGRYVLRALPPERELHLVFQRGGLSAVLASVRVPQGERAFVADARLVPEATLSLEFGAPRHGGLQRLGLLGRRSDAPAALPGIALVVDETPAADSFRLPPGRWLLRLHELDAWDRVRRVGPWQVVDLEPGGQGAAQFQMP